MARPAHEQALLAWIRNVIGPRYDASHPTGVVPVIYSDGRGPRPVKPYLTMLILVDDAEGEPEVLEDWTGTQLDRSIQSKRAGTVSVVAYGDNHGDMMRRLDASRRDPATMETNRDAGLFIRRPVSAIQRLSVVSNGVVEDRSVLDFAFAYTYSDLFEADADYIDEVILEPDLTP